jgi:hypothetical protein
LTFQDHLLAERLTPAQDRIIALLKKHRIPGTGRVKWLAIQAELPRCWQSHIVRQQVQFAMGILGAASVDELIFKHDQVLEARGASADLVG